jgi:hypothetical protein
MPPSNLTQIVYWEFLLGEELTMTGNPLVPATFPPMRPGMIIEISAVGNFLRYAINAVAALTSHGYVPENGTKIIGPLSNWTSISLIGNVGSTACVTLYRENVK